MTERMTDDGRLTADADLLARYARSGDETAFAELVRRHLNGVYSAAFRRVGGDAHLAQDVAQKVFVALARKADAVSRHPHATSWLYSVTRNEAANAVRGERRRRAREEEAMTMQNDTAENSPLADWSRVAPVLDEVVDELSDVDRAAILLRFVDRRPFAEIGTALRVSEDAARMRVDRALDKLRVLLGRRGVTSTAAALGVVLGNHAVVAAPAGLAASVTGAALTGGAAATAGVLTFMSMGKIAVAVIAVGGIAGLGFGVYGIRQSAAADEARLAAIQEREQLRANLRRAEARANDAALQTQKLEAQLVAVAKTGATTNASEANPASADDAALAIMKAKVTKAAAEKRILNDAQARNPETQQAMLKLERLSYPVRFGPLYAQLGLSREQITRFEQRLSAASEATMDVMAAAQTKGLGPDDPAVMTLANQEKAAFVDDMRALLGDAGFQQYQNYDRTLPAREAVNAMLGNMLAAQVPLTAEQVNQLTQLVANRSASYQQGGRVSNRGRDVAWRDVATDAAALLSPAQLQVFRAAAVQATANSVMQSVAEAMLKSQPDAEAANVPPKR